MSAQWWLRWESEHGMDDIAAEIRSLPNTSDTSEFKPANNLVELRGVALAAVFPRKPNAPSDDLELYGFERNVTVRFTQVRGKSFSDFLRATYECVFHLADWDRGDMWFSQDDRGIFVRRGGRYLINPEAFNDNGLAKFLPAVYDVADPPEVALRKLNWTESRVEQSDEPKSR